MQQRYYDPQSGRFLSRDPIALDMNTAWNFNRYNYAANDPYRFTDPDGRRIKYGCSNAEQVTTDEGARSEIAAELITKLDDSPHLWTIRLENAREQRDPNNQSGANPNNVGIEDASPRADGSPGSGQAGEIILSRSVEAVMILMPSPSAPTAQNITTGETLVHELDHAVQAATGTLSTDRATFENHARDTENSYRVEQGIPGLRPTWESEHGQ